MRAQTELKYAIGYKDGNAEFDRAVIALASHFCGGCFVTEGRGYWCEDGAEKGVDRFKGKMQSEHCLHITLTTEDAKLEGVMQGMKNGIRELVRIFSVDTQWVHVQAHAITGHHFDATASD